MKIFSRRFGEVLESYGVFIIIVIEVLVQPPHAGVEIRFVRDGS